MSRWRLLTGHVDRLAHRATGVVQVRVQVRQLDEVLEVGERRVAAAVVEVVDERRAVVGREHGGVAADLHRVGRVAGVLDVDGRCGGDERSRHMPRGKRTRVPSTSAPASAKRSTRSG